MNENEIITKWEERFDENVTQIANMDENDFILMLMESRIIQAS